MPNKHPNQIIKKAVCYHDGECPLCKLEIKLMQKVDKNSAIEWIDITKDKAALAKAGITYKQAMDRIHVIDANKEMQTGVQGFIAVWKHLPYYRYLVPIVKLPFIFPIMEMGYRVFARYRLSLTGRNNTNV